ncbi:hypothetical protein P0F39_001351 [Vibrio metschnikovii]|uniref:hypothetical protein n=1 Tax=Vibrio TaxID=662 RepID=UPI001C301E5E|nr:MULTISPECIES: hypothetical protein [Vibrio]EKO3779829.1 hypothetical protein [Vibrio metschnikovii]EKO3886891.1 hypothetical protein [Vibrio metschnikovii]EKO3935903.1 hypothetical protein [Vibrio metschnikovii]MCG3736727.1 hypothetical protein [Vibrio cincinnatiensis]MDM7486419.1 hypothetical protein [Vibrio metschnikovii]
MRIAPHRRRRWNNILIILVLLFIGVLNLPPLLKSYLMSNNSEEQVYPSLFIPNTSLQAVYTRSFELIFDQNEWQVTPSIDATPEQLVQRWQALVGTEVDEQTVRALQPNLIGPQTIEVWYQDLEEPQRITYYQAPQFWLFKNWQDKWIAISVEADYLFPSSSR